MLGATVPNSSDARPECRVVADLAAARGRRRADRLHPPGGTLAHLAVCRELGVSMVIGTTGFDEARKGRDRRGREEHRDRDGAQHERRRQRRRSSCSRWRHACSTRLRHRNHRSAPSPQGRRAVAAPRSRWARSSPARWARPEGLRGLRARRRYRRARPVDDRLRHDPRRRHRRRPHGAVRRHRRTHRDHARSSSRATYAKAACARRASWPASRPGCSTCSTCSACNDRRRWTARLTRTRATSGRRRRVIRADAPTLLLAMSVASWVLILWKAWAGCAAPRATARSDGRSGARRRSKPAIAQLKPRRHAKASSCRWRRARPTPPPHPAARRQPRRADRPLAN